MAIQIKHSFVSAKGDGGDATLVRPSNWNALHTTSMASGQLIGRLTAGAGVFEEIPISAYMAGLLAAPDAATLATLLGLFDTGDVKYTFKSSAPAGWIFMLGGQGVGAGNGCTIGSAASGAVIRANADTLNLYTMIWNNCSDAVAPVNGGRGASAAADFAANKMLTVPYLTGRSPIGAGAATSSLGLSVRTLGQSYGEETHLLSTTEMPSHYHPIGMSDGGHTHGNDAKTGSTTTGGGAFGAGGNGAATISSALTGVRASSPNGVDTSYSTGGSVAHNNVHPVLALNVLVKL